MCSMSAIGYYCSVEKVKGKEGEDRVVIIMNGKFLPHVEQVKLFVRRDHVRKNSEQLGS